MKSNPTIRASGACLLHPVKTLPARSVRNRPPQKLQRCFRTSLNQLPVAAKNKLNSTFVMVTRMKKVLILLALVTLGGCATASNTYLSDGKQGLSIDCSGEAMSWAKCYEKADASCAGTGYNIIATDGSPAVAEHNKTLGVDVGNFKSRNIVVACK